jgi:membrane associated rhomboid family serine protease
MSYTIILVLITVGISIAGFNNETVINKLILWPRVMDKPGEYYRLLTSGFIHADWNHLIFNMLTMFFIGQSIEGSMYVGEKLPILYLSGIVIASLPSFLKNRNNSYYRSLGASGGVSSILFFMIYYFPWSRINIMFIPIGIPSILFGILYLAYEAYMGKKGGGNVNHDAHFWGAVYGLFFALMIDPSHGLSFVDTLLHPH